MRPAVWRWLFVGAVAASLVLLYWPRPVSAPGGVPHLDKLVHLVTFAGMGWTGVRAGVPLRVLLPGLLLHAVSSEWLQEVALDRRGGDPLDAAADLLGALAGSLLARASWRGERVRAG